MPDSAFFALALTLAGAGLAVAAWALLADCSRGRRRCPKCWYSMTGITGTECPECGHQAKRERRFFRTRRHWKWATVSLIPLLAATVVSFWPKASRDGWMAILPERVVIELAPFGRAQKELARRLGLAPGPNGRTAETLSVQGRMALLGRAISGNALARPLDDRWKGSYGQVLRDWQWRLFTGVTDGPLTTFDGKPADEELVALVSRLADLPVELHVRTRERWPEGVPILIEATIDKWWPLYMFDMFRVRWVANGGSSSGVGEAGGYFTPTVPEHGEVTLDLDFDILQEDSKQNPRTRRIVQHETRQVHYATAATVDDVIAPLDSEQLNSTLTATSTATYGRFLELKMGDSKNMEDVAFGVTADVIHDSVVVMTYHMRWLSSTTTVTTSMDAPDWRAADEAIEAGRGQSGWTVHIRSDPIWALYILDAKRYWKGDITLPLAWGPAPRRFRPTPAAK